jgi:transposase
LLSLINSTIQDVSVQENIGYDVIDGILDRKVSTKIDWGEINKIDYLGIDEISIKKGHRDFVVIVTAFIAGKLRILGVLENRAKATVKQFFMSIPKRLRKTISKYSANPSRPLKKVRDTPEEVLYKLVHGRHLRQRPAW